MRHTNYFCDRCNRIFNKKYDYERHINKKYPCKKISTNIEMLKNNQDINTDIIRLYEKILEKDLEISRLNAVIEEKNNMIQSLIKKDKNNIIINIDKVTINIATFGTESCTKLYSEEKKAVLSSGDACIISMIRHIHANDRLPEYKNVCITNMRSSGGYIYENNMWKFNKHDDILYLLLTARMSDLDDLINDKNITDEINNINKIKKIVSNYWDNSDRFLKEYKKPIITALYNYTKNNMDRYKIKTLNT